MALTLLLITTDMKAHGRNQIVYERMSDFQRGPANTKLPGELEMLQEMGEQSKFRVF